MDFAAFKASVANDDPPAGVAGPLVALWYADKGSWHRAHEIVQDDESADAAWVHAYLHRVEGDLSNAAYWYRRANKPVAEASLDEEWQEISQALLGRA